MTGSQRGRACHGPRGAGAAQCGSAIGWQNYEILAQCLHEGLVFSPLPGLSAVGYTHLSEQGGTE